MGVFGKNISQNDSVFWFEYQFGNYLRFVHSDKGFFGNDILKMNFLQSQNEWEPNFKDDVQR